MKRHIIATYALTYANGPIHLGHLLGHVQTDIWTRFQKMRGHECYFIGGSDTHGTPIMLKAEQLKQSPADMVAKISQEQRQDLHAFGIHFDGYELTNSKENQALSHQIYLRLRAQGDIVTKIVNQAFDEQYQMFLPDRYVKGTCPCCCAPDQYSDSCEACGSTYEGTTGLKNPISVLSQLPPTYKDSVHYFFQLSRYSDFLKNWTSSTSAHLQPEVSKKIQEWFKEGLKDWDISRDAPYYGFEIPDAPGKYFYVWLDAPIGYLSSFKSFAERAKLKFDSYWKPDTETELYHFIGKDITYFHALFWPAILQGAGYRTPSYIQTHGFLTINGEKMSKSRGTFITANAYLKTGLNSDYLRYYFAAKLGSSVEDIDLNWNDFRLRVNADLVGKVINIASRCAKFIEKYFEGQLAAELAAPALFAEVTEASKTLAESYEHFEYSKAMRDIMGLADLANQFIDQQKPWELIKNPDSFGLTHQVCTTGLNLYKQLITYLAPVLPKTAQASEVFLNTQLNWKNLQKPLLSHRIEAFKPLLMRVDESALPT